MPPVTKRTSPTKRSSARTRIASQRALTSQLSSFSFFTIRDSDDVIKILEISFSSQTMSQKVNQLLIEIQTEKNAQQA